MDGKTITIPRHGGADPEDRNDKRVAHGDEVIDWLASRYPGDERVDLLTNLLANLMHWCHAQGDPAFDFTEAVETAAYHFSEETAPE